MSNELYMLKKAHEMAHMDSETFDAFYHRVLKEKAHRDELDLHATTSRCVAPHEKLDPCHLCPHNRHDARQPAQPNPVDTIKPTV